jgi:hypothetical protein
MKVKISPRSFDRCALIMATPDRAKNIDCAKQAWSESVIITESQELL